MVKKQLKLLKRLSLQSVTQYVKKLSYEHTKNCDVCSNYNTEKCVTFQIAKKNFHLPGKVLKSIFTELYNAWNAIDNEEVVVLYFFTTLLYFSGLRIDTYYFSKYHCVSPFLELYGKNVNELSLDIYRRKLLNLDVFTNMLFFSNSITTIDFDDVPVTDEYLAAVGIECQCLSEIKRFALTENITTQGFQKLCFRDYPTNMIKNNCCKALTSFHINFKYAIVDGHYTTEANEILGTVFTNLPNLKSIGIGYNFDFYLQNFTIQETNLEILSVWELSIKIVPLVKSFAPKLKQLQAINIERGALAVLNSCQLLDQIETLTCMTSHQYYEAGLRIRDLSAGSWSSLKKLSIGFDINHVRISILAEQLPQLEIIGLGTTGIIWNEEIYFKSLTEASFKVQVCENLNWCASFAKTIKSVNFEFFGFTQTEYQNKLCNLFLATPFPYLESFTAMPLSYNYNCITTVIKQCPSLRSFHVFGLRNTRREELAKFLQENNLECAFE